MLQAYAKRNIALLCLINFLVMLVFGAFNLLRPYLVLASWLPGIAVPFIIGGVIGFITLILFALYVKE